MIEQTTTQDPWDVPQLPDDPAWGDLSVAHDEGERDDTEDTDKDVDADCGCITLDKAELTILDFGIEALMKIGMSQAMTQKTLARQDMQALTGLSAIRDKLAAIVSGMPDGSVRFFNPPF